jgi:hypothetical protein
MALTTRQSFMALIVRELGNTLSNFFPGKGAISELAGKTFDALNPPVTIVTDNRTVTTDESNGVFGIATDAKVFTLPATQAGLKYTFVNLGANGNNILTISPQAADGICGTITLASTVVVDAGVVNKDVINTKATAKTGDSITLVGTGVAGTSAWVILASTGIWAAEA